MTCHHHRRALLYELLHGVHGDARRCTIERRCWLVENEESRTRGERTCNGDALSLAAGETARVFINFVAQLQAL